MGHKKKKVKKEDFENLYKEATRQWLLKASQYPLVRFYVHVQKINKDKILFDKVLFEMNSMFAYEPLEYGVEDHVWVEKKDFIKTEDIHPEDIEKQVCAEDYGDFITPYGVMWDFEPEEYEEIDFDDISVDDYLSFDATIVPYQRANGTLDLGLQKIRHIRRIEKDDYTLPTKDQLIDQEISNLVCETCLFYDHCNNPSMFCMRDESDVKKRFEYLKNFETGKFTPYTVLAAYEKEGGLISESISEQFTDGIKKHGLHKMSKAFANEFNDYPIQIQKMLMDSAINPPVTRFANPTDAMARVVMPIKPRRYIL